MYGKLILLGSTPGGEIWTTNFCFDPTGESPTWDQAAGDAQAAAAAAVVIPSNLRSAMSTALSVTGVRWEGRDDVTDALLGVSIAMLGTPAVGINTPHLPPQAALCFSLRTTTPGPRGRGRIYWPAVGVSILSSNLRLNPVDQTAMLNDFKTYQGLLKTALTSGGIVSQALAVRSRTSHSTPHVNSIRLGDVIDTQRRRRDKLIETYANVSVP